MEQMTFVKLVPQPEKSLRVKDLPTREQPVNRLREVGPSSVSTAELLACLLQSPQALQQAQELLVRFQGITGLLHATDQEISTIDGLGPAQAARIRAALELGRRLMAAPPADRYQIRAPSMAAQYLMSELTWLEREHFVVLTLDTRNRILGCETLYTGTLNTSIVRTSEVFQTAIKCNAASIIVAHNHPSGDATPSPEDIALTRRLVEAGKLMEIEVLDHLVIGHNSYISLRERGAGFETA